MRIIMRKISELEGFNEIFNIKPSYWGYQMVEQSEVQKELEEAKKMADAIDGICIAICIFDDGSEKAIGERIVDGTSKKFMLFNAKETDKVRADIRAITYNKGKGKLKSWWYDKWIGYYKGFVV